MIKKTVMLAMAAMIFCGGSLSAQISKGTVLISELTNINMPLFGMSPPTNLGFTMYKVKSDDPAGEDSSSDKEFAVNLGPRIGYFLVDNLVAGLDITFSYAHFNASAGDYLYNYTQVAAGPFLRYYTPTEKISPFAEVSYAFGSGVFSYTSDNFDNENKYQTQLFGFGFGLGIPLGEKISFDALAGYQSFINKNKDDNPNNQRSIAGTIGLKLGLTVIL